MSLEEDLKNGAEEIKNDMVLEGVKEDIQKHEENKPTEITVEKPEDHPDDVSKEEQEQIIESKPIDKSKFDNVISEADKLYQTLLKEEGIDPEHDVEYEDEEKLIPLITDEDLKLFAAASEHMFDETDISGYVKMAKEGIEDFKALKKSIYGDKSEDSSVELDEDTLSELEMATQNATESRKLLVVIQHECRKIRKDFEESHVAEDIIRGAVFNNMAKYIKEKFEYSDSFIDGNKAESRASIISENIKKYMFLPTYYKEWVHRRFNMAHGRSIADSVLTPYTFNKFLDYFIYAISTYARVSDKQNDANFVGKLINNDFKVMNFINPLIMYSLVKYNPELVNNIDKDGKEYNVQERFAFSENVLVPTEVSKNQLKLLSETVIRFTRDILYNSNHLSRLTNMYLDNFKRDKNFSKVEIKDIYDFKETCVALSDLIPDLDKTTIVRWGDSYKFFQKYIMWYNFHQVSEKVEAFCLKYENQIEVVDNVETPEGFEKDLVEIRKFIISKLLIPFVDHYFLGMYSDLITDISSNVKEYSRDIRSTMFASIINNLLLQHELGFKTKIDDPEIYYTDPDHKTVSNEIYNVAKKVFADQYQYIVGFDDKEDLFLKEVDLPELKLVYIQIAQHIIAHLNSESIELLYFDIKAEGGEQEFRYKCGFDERPTNNPKKSKKKSNKKKHK